MRRQWGGGARRHLGDRVAHVVGLQMGDCTEEPDSRCQKDEPTAFGARRPDDVDCSKLSALRGFLRIAEERRSGGEVVAGSLKDSAQLAFWGAALALTYLLHLRSCCVRRSPELRP